jgi:hypothetical protein
VARFNQPEPTTPIPFLINRSRMVQRDNSREP